jgi:copper chaperone CopZ
MRRGVEPMKCPHCGGDISAVLASVGGKARAKQLTKARRREIAKQGATVRWEKDRARKAKLEA